MNNDDKRVVQKHIGQLLSLLQMNAWRGLIGTMVKFWDSENMVFHRGSRVDAYYRRNSYQL